MTLMVIFASMGVHAPEVEEDDPPAATDRLLWVALAVVPAAPHRPHRVDDEPRREPVAQRLQRVTGLAARVEPALRQQIRPGRAVITTTRWARKTDSNTL